MVRSSLQNHRGVLSSAESSLEEKKKFNRVFNFFEKRNVGPLKYVVSKKRV